MRRTIGIYLLCLFWCSFVLASTIEAKGIDVIEVKSPDGRLRTAFFQKGQDKRLSYIISYDKETILDTSFLGVVKDGTDLGSNVTYGEDIVIKTRRDKFDMFGNHPKVDMEYTEAIIPVFRGAETYELVVRVYNKGVAVKSVLRDAGKCTVNGESLEWNLPDGAKVWFQDECHSYEGLFTHAELDTLAADKVVALPVSAKLQNGKYLLLTEANVINYSDLAMKTSSNHTLKAYFHADPKGWENNGSLEQPWRVVMVADDLNELVNNDMIYSLASPAKFNFKKKSWISPGRSTWHWWAEGAPVFDKQKQWIEWTAQLGFEYYLVDEGWKNWKKGDWDAWRCLKDVVDMAKENHVGIWLWVHSNEVNTPAKRDAYFQKVKQVGAVGIKIDFMPPASVKWINWYDETLQDAAKYQLMVDFHGAVKPSGRNRTWPHEMTREGVRGHEWHILRYKRTLPASHDCVLPFNRYVQGFADYTPTVLNPKELRGFSWPREIAQAIVFTSPFLCYADRPDYYLSSEALGLIKEIPSVWDETLVLPGSEIGECVVFARRKGDSWFLAVMNGEVERHLEIDFSFLKKNKSYQFESFKDEGTKDDGFIKDTQTVNCDDHMTLTVRPGGGFVGMFKQQR